MDDNSLTDEPYYCNVCRNARNPSTTDYSHGIFGPLLSKMDGKNPTSFRLPAYIQNYFEDVRANPDGEYEEGLIISKAKLVLHFHSLTLY
jgi:hypothetical protein